MTFDSFLIDLFNRKRTSQIISPFSPSRSLARTPHHTHRFFTAFLLLCKTVNTVNIAILSRCKFPTENQYEPTPPDETLSKYTHFPRPCSVDLHLRFYHPTSYRCIIHRAVSPHSECRLSYTPTKGWLTALSASTLLKFYRREHRSKYIVTLLPGCGTPPKWK